MQELSAEVLLLKARQLAESGKDWHFHILTPMCVFNKSDSVAFILENSSDKEVYVHASHKIERELGKELAKLFHGVEFVADNEEEPDEHEVTLAAKQMLDHARELNLQNKVWHHHLLNPQCTFNEIKDKWSLILEDPENDLMLKSVSDEKPVEDLKEVEALFSAQDF